MKEILHQLVGSSSHYVQRFIHPRWLAGFLPSTVAWIILWNMAHGKEKIATFWSHSWHGSRWQKISTLFLLYNGWVSASQLIQCRKNQFHVLYLLMWYIISGISEKFAPFHSVSFLLRCFWLNGWLRLYLELWPLCWCLLFLPVVFYRASADWPFSPRFPFPFGASPQGSLWRCFCFALGVRSKKCSSIAFASTREMMLWSWMLSSALLGFSKNPRTAPKRTKKLVGPWPNLNIIIIKHVTCVFFKSNEKV